jgi:predicted flap endonuclease-1-like 5' DNA nuclease
MDGAAEVLARGPSGLLAPQIVVLGILFAAAVGAWIGWWFRGVRNGARKQAVAAFESELVRAAGRARERARQEKTLLEERLERIQDEHDGCEARIRALERQLRESASAERPKGGLTRTRASRANGGGNGHRKREAAVALIAKAEDPSAAPAWLVPSSGKKDDLQAIRGLGPVFEKRLNDLGICQYRQLAGLQRDHIDWIAARIHILSGRILHDDWVSQAREKHFEKYNERI